MKIAVLTDIHGNYKALQTCLEHAKNQDVDMYVFLGDYLGEFAYPQRTLEILYDLRSKYDCVFIRGNKEDYWINRRKDVNCDWKNGNRSIWSMIYNYENLTDNDIDFFETLPISRSINIKGKETILVCHGTPFANNRRLSCDDEETREIVNKCSEKIILCGHSHIQRIIMDGEKTVLNVGAVGVPLHVIESTQYLILESETNKWNYDFITLPYDADIVIKDLHEAGIWDKTPYWCRITQNLLRTGELPHGEVLGEVMKLNGYKDPWYRIDDCYWDSVLNNLGIE